MRASSQRARCERPVTGRSCRGELMVLLSHIKGEIVSQSGCLPCHRVVELTCIACDIGVLHTREEDSYEDVQVLTPH
jgi:hypothetical protein